MTRRIFAIVFIVISVGYMALSTGELFGLVSLRLGVDYLARGLVTGIVGALLLVHGRSGL